MKSLKVDRLTFEFPDDWSISKYDEWSFYKHKFQSMCGGGIKGVDILAIDPQKTAWLIEIKDYRQFPRVKTIEIAPEVAEKTFDTLAGLLPAKVASDVPEETNFVRAMHASTKLRVVLHLEQPTKHSVLFPRAIELLDVQQKLRSLVRPVDAHALVCETHDLRKVPWKVIKT